MVTGVTLNKVVTSLSVDDSAVECVYSFCGNDSDNVTEGATDPHLYLLRENCHSRIVVTGD